MEKEFDTWLETMISRMEAIDRKIKENGKLNGEATRLLMDRAIQPFGLWSPESNKTGSNALRSVFASWEGKSSLTEIANEFGLSVDGDILRIPGNGVSKEQFSKAAKRLEALGYEYKKGKSAFGPKWNGVKQ